MLAEINNGNRFEPCLAADRDGLGGGSFDFSLYCNPLNKEIGDTVVFRQGDLAGLSATVTQILSTRLVVDGEIYTFADYDLVAPGIAGAEALADDDGYVRIRLRCLPTEAGRYDTAAFQAQKIETADSSLFRTYWNRNEGVTLRDHEGNFQHGFSRIDDVTNVYEADRMVLGDPNLPGGGKNQTSHHKIQYLDYQRETRDDAGIDYTQYALVEFNPQTESLITLFGWDIEPGSFR